MGVFSRVFGTDEAVSKGFSLVDEAFYTKEEKAEDEIKRSNAKATLLQSYQAYKLAQRLLATYMTIPFVGIHCLVAILWLIMIMISLFVAPGESYDFVAAELGKVADMNNRTLGEPLAWVFIFYFGGGAGEGVVAKIASVMRKKK